MIDAACSQAYRGNAFLDRCGQGTTGVSATKRVAASPLRLAWLLCRTYPPGRHPDVLLVSPFTSYVAYAFAIPASPLASRSVHEDLLNIHISSLGK